ncbi:hypothetical protein SHIRM173S_13369 [Streptomyces hirsutus]
MFTGRACRADRCAVDATTSIEDTGNARDTEYDTTYDGVDALMAAILDEPLPTAARRDPAFMAARDAAATDVAVLREQLGLIGEMLAAREMPSAGETPAVGAEAAGSGAAPAAGASDAPVDRPGYRPAAGPLTPVTPLPVHRPRRRPLRVALGALAAAAAASVVLGTGWLVTQAGQGDGTSSSAEADRKAVEAGEAPGAKGSAGTGFGTPHYLACARLVAEGTVSAVEPVPGTGQERVTLEVTRRYKPARGPARTRTPPRRNRRRNRTRPERSPS